MNKALLLCCVKIKEGKSKLFMIYILLNSFAMVRGIRGTVPCCLPS